VSGSRPLGVSGPRRRPDYRTLLISNERRTRCARTVGRARDRRLVAFPEWYCRPAARSAAALRHRCWWACCTRPLRGR